MIKEIVKDVMFLSQKAKKATEKDKYIANDLLDTLKANRDRCVGLAANMIGYNKAIIYVSGGLYDFVMGARRFYREDIEKHHNRLKTRISRTNRQKAWWCLKVIYVRLMVCYKKIQNAYRRENK